MNKNELRNKLNFSFSQIEVNKIIENINFDFYLPEINTLILFADNSNEDKNYYVNIIKKFRGNTNKVMIIFEWDLIDNIITLLTREKDVVYGRKCEVKEITDVKIVKDFISKYNLQGSLNKNDFTAIGLFYENKLISLIQFGKPRYNKNVEWELWRSSSCKNVLGGLEKMFKKFFELKNPKSIVTYCDMSKFDGRSYFDLGFKIKSIAPSIHWYNKKEDKSMIKNTYCQSNEVKNKINHFKIGGITKK